ncbi:MAG: peptidoglycan-binding domain-containing protein [bacterium]|nr:peptidoglycan-binding domain-containing protein [bacterium]
MSKFSTKAVAAGVSVATAAWLSGAAMFVPVVGAQTTADLQAQITDLLAKITALQAQLGASTSTYSFTRSLTVGSTGADVKALQQWLNANGYPVAATGAGSAGNETSYFGTLTRAAVAKYQAAKGISPAVGYFGPITRAALAAAAPAPTTPTTPSTGVEGSVTVKLAGTLGDNQEVREGWSDIPVVSYEVKATNNNVTLNRVDLNFSKRPWLSFSNISLWDGSTKVGEVTGPSASNFTEVTAGSDYQLRLSGLSVAISKDQTKVLTLKVSMPVKAEGTTDMTVNALAQSFRATDATGKTQDAPTGDLVARTINLSAKTATNLEVISDTAAPTQDRYVQVSATDTTEVELVRFKLKATNSAAKVSSLEIGTDGTSTVAGTAILDNMKLYVDGGTTAVATAAITATTSTFSSLEDSVGVIAKDSTKSFIVKGVVKKNASNYGEGEAIQGIVDANAAGIVGVDASSFADATITGSQQTGKLAYLVSKGPIFAHKSGTFTAYRIGTSDTGTYSAGTADLTWTVTAFGSDIYLKKYSATAASSGALLSTTVVGAGMATTTYTFDTVALDGNPVASTGGDNYWTIPAGSTRGFEGTLDSKNVNAGFTNAYVVNFKWDTSSTSITPTTTTFGLADFKTNNLFLANQPGL